MAKKKKKLKDRIKTAVKDVKSGVKKAVDRVQDLGSDAVLLPLMVPMAGFLKLQGVKPDKDPTDRAKQVYDIIQKGVGKGKLEGYEFETNLTPLEELESENVVGVVVTEIIAAVVTFFKGLADKKREGKIKEGSAIAKVADAAIIAEDETISLVKEQGQFELGKFITDNILLIAIGAVVAILIIKNR